jgi:hypothetical protein
MAHPGSRPLLSKCEQCMKVQALKREIERLKAKINAVVKVTVDPAVLAILAAYE